jgi:hypothetical protein
LLYPHLVVASFPAIRQGSSDRGADKPTAYDGEPLLTLD